MIVISPIIINKLKQGDETCFNIVFNAYFARFHSFAMKFVKDSSVSEILVQDLFLLLWNKKSMLDCDSEIGLLAWLYTSLRHLCYRELQRIKKEKLFSCDLSLSECQLNIEALRVSNEEDNGYEELYPLILSQIEKLPAQCQRVFMMSRFEGLQNFEIAEYLNISIKAVEANITRAVKELKSHLRGSLPLIITIVINQIIR